MPLRTLDEWIAAELKDDLRDPAFALGYLQACFEEAQANNNATIFFSAVHDVARANEAASTESDASPNEPRAVKTRRNGARHELVPA